MDPHLPTVFDMLQYFETIFPPVESLYFDILYKLRYISWVVSLLRPVKSPIMVAILAAILDFIKN